MHYRVVGLKVTARFDNEAQRFLATQYLDTLAAGGPETALGDRTKYNAERAVLMAAWEAARAAYDEQEQLAQDGDPAKVAHLDVLKEDVADAHRRLKVHEDPRYA